MNSDATALSARLDALLAEYEAIATELIAIEALTAVETRERADAQIGASPDRDWQALAIRRGVLLDALNAVRTHWTRAQDALRELDD